MALSQINNYGVGDNNFTSFQETLDATRRGLAEITLSEYDTDLAPSVKVGSVFENNGAFFQVSTSDATPTGYSGISNSTTFFLYFDESATAFIYSSTAPTWNDARQGWYNGDDRAFFSMFKDSGGTLYTRKMKLIYSYNNNIYQGSAVGIGNIYDDIASYIPTVGDGIPLAGTYSVISTDYVSILNSAVRNAVDQITLYSLRIEYVGGTKSTTPLTATVKSGDLGNTDYSITVITGNTK